MAKTGYNAVRWMRRRDKALRGGNRQPDDGLDRGGSTLAAYVDDYLDDLRMRNRTPDAVESRRNELRPFLRWAEERGLFHPEQIARSILESYQRWLWRYRKKNGKPLGVSTQRQRLGGVKNLFAWFCRKRVLEANPASEIELPRSEKRLPIEALSRSEVETVLGVPDATDPLGVRDRAILELFYATGIRRSELVRIDHEDLDRERGVLAVRGKGRKDRVVPVGERALHWIGRYLERTRPLLLTDLNEHALFLTGYGERFSAQYIGNWVRGTMNRAGIGRGGSCHLLRHSCATHMLENGADIRFIQQLLGHARLDTTQIYTEVSIVQLREVHARTHPHARLREDATARQARLRRKTTAGNASP